uniref:Uncharacterized protein n=1 Tax=Globodera rostochiensis TaxID=31243 RepID=A0A914GX26_GLORO
MTDYKIEELYKEVVAEVLSHVRDAFSDDGADSEALNQLKLLWEDKIQRAAFLAIANKKSAAATSVSRDQARAVTRCVIKRENGEHIQNIVLVPNYKRKSSISDQPLRVVIKRQAQCSKLSQLDGARAGMSDSSSEDDVQTNSCSVENASIDNMEEYRQESQYESSLNSDDDLSDEEGLESLFDSCVIVLCQFEKVTHVRNSWKFRLKSGLVNIQGTEFCFQSCHGEADW